MKGFDNRHISILAITLSIGSPALAADNALWHSASGELTSDYGAAIQSWRTDPEYTFSAGGSTSWAGRAMHAEDAYVRGITGSGVRVGVLDSGVDITHPDLSGASIHPVTTSGTYAGNSYSYDAQWEWNRGKRQWTQTFTPVLEGRKGDQFSIPGTYDSRINDSHGTLVSGTIAGARNGVGMQGIAFGSSLYVANTGGTDDNRTQGSNALDYNYFHSALDALGKNGARIVNQSWGQNSSINAENLTDNTGQLIRAYGTFAAKAKAGSPTWLDAEADATKKHSFVNVVAASNDPMKNPDLLGALPYYKPELEKQWLAVSGYAPNGTQVYNQCGVASYWCVVAPTVFPSSSAEGGHEMFNGTSAAAPTASAALALIMQRFPYLTPEQARDVMLTTAHELVPTPGTNTSQPITTYAPHDSGQTYGYLTPLADGNSGVPNAVTGWGLPDVRKALNGPGQLLGHLEAKLPGNVKDTWSNNISDTATRARRAIEEAQLAELQAIEREDAITDGGKTTRLTEAERQLVKDLISAKESILANYGKDPLTGKTFVGSLTKDGAGTLILTGQNSYTGSTVIKDGTLVAGSSTALGTGDVAIFGGKLTLAADHFTIGGGLTVGEFGILDLDKFWGTFAVLGEANLFGTLELDIGSILGEGLYRLFSYSGHSGHFKSVLWEHMSSAFWEELVYNADGLYMKVSGVHVSSVPLPASAPMFGAALLLLCIVAYGGKYRNGRGRRAVVMGAN